MVAKRKPLNKPVHYIVVIKDVLGTLAYLSFRDVEKYYYVSRFESIAECFPTKLLAVKAYNEWVKKLNDSPKNAWAQVRIKGIMGKRAPNADVF